MTKQLHQHRNKILNIFRGGEGRLLLCFSDVIISIIYAALKSILPVEAKDLVISISELKSDHFNFTIFFAADICNCLRILG